MKGIHTPLALLFYGMAISDNNLDLGEKKEIYDAINSVKEVSISEKEKEEMYDTLREAIKNNLSSETSLERFKEFYVQHKTHFSETLKAEILELIDGIALKMNGRNKSESVYYSQVFLLFQQ